MNNNSLEHKVVWMLSFTKRETGSQITEEHFAVFILPDNVEDRLVNGLLVGFSLFSDLNKNG